MTRALRHQPVRPMTAACCTAEDVTFDTTSADGEPVGVTPVVLPMRDVAVRTDYTRGLTSTAARQLAWARNPTCVECHRRILAAHLSGLLETSEGPRVAHKAGGCLVLALARIHPAIRVGRVG